ncbi:MAG: peptidylprolyl isomerase [Thermoanaerobaculales bacterium]|nr:peptidylprolyl isomerase [Thermoanaerobaculales bacterium]
MSNPRSRRLFSHPFHRLVATIIATGALVILAACGAGAGSKNLVARSDLGELTRADLEAYILTRPEVRRRPGEGESLKEWRAGLTRDLLMARALAAKGEELSSQPQFTAQIRQARETALVDAARQRLVDSRIDVDEEDLRLFYDEHPDLFGHPEQIRLRHIFRRVARDAIPQERARARAEMEQLLERIRGGGHFGDLAREYSDSETAHLEGLIGRITRGALDPSLEEIVWKLDEGEFSEVMETPVGFHFFNLDGRFEPSHMDFEDARGRLTRRLIREARERLEREALMQILAESQAVHRPELLDAGSKIGPGDVLFSISDRVITMADVQTYLDTASFLKARKTPPEEWLALAVRRELLLWKALQMDLATDPAFTAALEHAETEAKARVGASYYLQKRIAEHAEAGAVDEYYDQHYRRFQTPKMYRLRLITVNFEGYQRHYDVYELLEDLAKEIRSGRRDMAAAAREISDDLSAAAGGDTGWLLLEGIATWAGPRAQQAVIALKEGELSDPLLIERYDKASLTFDRDGYTLIRVENIRFPEVLTLEESWDKVVKRYSDVHRLEFEEETRREVFSEINAEILRKNL